MRYFNYFYLFFGFLFLRTYDFVSSLIKILHQKKLLENYNTAQAILLAYNSLMSGKRTRAKAKREMKDYGMREFQAQDI